LLIGSVDLEIENLKKKYSDLAALNKKVKEDLATMTTDKETLEQERDKLSRTLQVHFFPSL
jgi:hypothetical protein